MKYIIYILGFVLLLSSVNAGSFIAIYNLTNGENIAIYNKVGYGEVFEANVTASSDRFSVNLSKGSVTTSYLNYSIRKETANKCGANNTVIVKGFIRAANLTTTIKEYNLTFNETMNYTAGKKYCITWFAPKASGAANNYILIQGKRNGLGAPATYNASTTVNSGTTWKSAKVGVENWHYHVIIHNPSTVPSGYLHKIDSVSVVKLYGVTPIKVNTI